MTDKKQLSRLAQQHFIMVKLLATFTIFLYKELFGPLRDSPPYSLSIAGL